MLKTTIKLSKMLFFHKVKKNVQRKTKKKKKIETCAERLISGVESQIGQNNQYKIYPDMNFISFLNM